MPKILLRDAPGARAFVNRVVNAAEDLAIAMTGRPDDEVEAQLVITGANLRRDLAPLMGVEVAAEIVDIFARAVRGEIAERRALAAKGLLD
jgi:hypothetical protein